MRKPSLDCAPQYFKLRMTTSRLALSPLTFSRMTSPLPSFNLACATHVLASTFHENAAVCTAFFCQGIGYSCPGTSASAVCSSLVTLGCKCSASQERCEGLQSL